MLIRSHAGLVGDGLANPTLISGALAHQQDVDIAVGSFVAALQRLNVELNGPTPTGSVADSDRRMLPAQLVYAVTEVSRMLRDEGQTEAAWAVDTAWLAVLAGDIDDVSEHVAEERATPD